MIDLNALKQFTELQQEQVKKVFFNIASIAEIIGVMDMSDIVEKGDGYIRFENGIQICFDEFNITSTWTPSNRHNNENIIFSKEFISKPIVITNNSGAGGYWSSSALNITNSNFDFSFGMTSSSQYIGTVMCQYFAFGFWKEI